MGRERGVLAPSSPVTVVKLDPKGREVARYSAVVVDEVCPEPWITVRATWTMKRVDASGVLPDPCDPLAHFALGIRAALGFNEHFL